MNFIQYIDDSILYFIQDHMVNPFLNILMPFITHLGDAGFIWIVISIILLITKKYRKFGICMILSLILSFVLSSIVLKNVFMRPRPCFVNPSIKLLIDIPKGFSFPSGHSMCSFAPATVLFLMNKKVGIPALVLAFLIAFSRLYLFVHYPSDVLVGSIIGVIIGIISVKLINKFYKKKSII
ncbi:MAG: phosphatase PAP2 family protein [Clostridium sp.]